MQHRLVLPLAVLCGLAALPLAGWGAPETPSADSSASAPGASGKKKRTEFPSLLGEVTDTKGGTFMVRPYNPRLPKRVEVTTDANTRYLEEKRVDLHALHPDDWVLVVLDPKKTKRATATATPTPSTETPAPSSDPKAAPEKPQKKSGKKNKPAPASTPAAAPHSPAAAGAPAAAPKPPPTPEPPHALAVLRLWEPEDGRIRKTDEPAAKALLEAAKPFFKGWRLGSVELPKHPKYVVGQVQTVEPFTLRIRKDVQEYRLGEHYLVVDHVVSTPKELERGKTVHVQTGDAIPREDTSIQAELVVYCPEPRIKPQTQRKLILRDRKDPKDDKTDSGTPPKNEAGEGAERKTEAAPNPQPK